jgi:RNA polymerase sigma-70 factor, ECF subfamily
MNEKKMQGDGNGTDVEDAELAGRVLRDGSEEAFRILYRRHTPALYSFVLRLLGGAGRDARGTRDARDAEDVVQDTWMRAMERLAGFRWEASFRTWLCGIALNRAREVRRKSGRTREEPSPETEPAPELPGTAERIDLEMDLEEAIRRLPDGYREVLLLHDHLGLTHEEIARELGITAGTSRSQLHFARRAVRRHLTAGSHP